MSERCRQQGARGGGEVKPGVHRPPSSTVLPMRSSSLSSAAIRLLSLHSRIHNPQRQHRKTKTQRQNICQSVGDFSEKVGSMSTAFGVECLKVCPGTASSGVSTGRLVPCVYPSPESEG